MSDIDILVRLDYQLDVIFIDFVNWSVTTKYGNLR